MTGGGGGAGGGDGTWWGGGKRHGGGEGGAAGRQGPERRGCVVVSTLSLHGRHGRWATGARRRRVTTDATGNAASAAAARAAAAAAAALGTREPEDRAGVGAGTGAGGVDAAAGVAAMGEAGERWSITGGPAGMPGVAVAGEVGDGDTAHDGRPPEEREAVNDEGVEPAGVAEGEAPPVVVGRLHAGEGPHFGGLAQEKELAWLGARPHAVDGLGELSDDVSESASDRWRRGSGAEPVIGGEFTESIRRTAVGGEVANGAT